MNFGLTVVTLGVADLARSRAFYERGLGLAPSSASGGNIVFYRCGPTLLALYPRAGLLEDACRPAEEAALPRPFDGVTLACNCPGPAEVDALLARAAAAGGSVAKPGQPTFWGGYSGYFADPDGHLWEVAHIPGWELDSRRGLQLPDEKNSAEEA